MGSFAVLASFSHLVHTLFIYDKNLHNLPLIIYKKKTHYSLTINCCQTSGQNLGMVILVLTVLFSNKNISSFILIPDQHYRHKSNFVQNLSETESGHQTKFVC